MIKNYFKTAWRNMKRTLSFSFINIFGLAIGIVCAALIFLWAEYQFAYNRQLPGSNDIYLVKNNQFYGKDIMTMNATCGPLAGAMYNEIPGFNKVVRTLDAGGIFSVADKFLSQGGIYADSSFFDLFQYPVVQKLPDFSLSNPGQIAISAKMAKAFFKENDALGKAITFNKKDIFTIGLIYDIPSRNMAMQPTFVIPMNKPMADTSFAKNWSYWGNCGIRTYATLQPNVPVHTTNQQLKNFILKKSGNDVHHEVFLFPYTELGLYNSFKNGANDPSNGKIKYVKMFITIAFIILLIACINFMNLSTARSEKRAKEIGLKKVVGATRTQLMGQFMLESILMAMLAVVLAIVVLVITVPLFGRLVDIPLKLDLLNPVHFFSILAIGLLCGLVAGSYPCIYLSSFNPISAIKKQFSKKQDGAGFIRKALVVIQFSVSVMLIVATIVIYSQVKHAQHRDLGYDKEKIIQISTSDELIKNFNALRQQLLQDGQVQEVAMANSSMFSMYSNGGGFRWTGGEGKQDALITFLLVTPEYLKLMNIGLAEGRNFYNNIKSDSGNILINHEMAQLMGKEGHAGKMIYRGDGNEDALHIIGVTRPFLANDIYGNSPPTIIYPEKPENIAQWGGSIFIKLSKTTDLPAQLKRIESGVKKIDGSFPFEARFLDDDFNNLFKGEQFIGTLALLFGSLAILISCLGLFGLSAYMTGQRTKEIGVRKVLGASVSGISALLSRDFLKLVCLSLLIALPAAWYVMYSWLQNYTYRVGLHWWIFVIAGLGALLIALATVSFQAIKAAVANPIKALRSE